MMVPDPHRASRGRARTPQIWPSRRDRLTVKTPRLLAAVAAAATLALTGCGRADTAAVVDGHVITESGIFATSEQVAEYASQPMATSDLLNRLVVLPAVLEVLGERGVTISDAAARSAVATIDSPTPYLLDLARLDLAIGQLTQDDMAEVTRRLAEADVEINPRFGSFNPEQAAVVATSPDWIVDAAGDR
jgi:hypothetical protein